MTKLEDVLRYHGDPGKCQLVLWGLVLFCLFHMGMIQQFNIFMSYIPKHECKIPLTPLTNETEQNRNITITQCKVQYVINDVVEEETLCPDGWSYADKEVFPVQDFDLVCPRDYLLMVAVMVTFVGVMIGGLIFGSISDHFGRQRSMAFILTVISILNTSVYFAQQFSVFVGLRFFLGIFCQGLQTNCLTYGSELFLPRMRTVSHSLIGFMWSLMLPFLSLLMYLLGHWRLVHLTMGIMSIVSALYVWFLPESIPWLLNKGDTEAAMCILNKIGRMNGVPPMPTLKDDLEEISASIQRKKARTNPKCSNLLQTPVLRKITFSTLYIWLATACGTLGLSFAISGLKGNIFIIYTITGSVDFSMRVLVMYFFFLRYGRIKIMSTIIILCGILTIASYLLQHYTPDEYVIVHYIAIGAAIFGRNLIALNFTMLGVYTSEVFPTFLRSTGIGLGFAFARVGNIITPITFYALGTLVWRSLPPILYSAMVIAAGCLMLTLPETFNKALPVTVEDVEDLVRGRSFRGSGRNKEIKEGPEMIKLNTAAVISNNVNGS